MGFAIPGVPTVTVPLSSLRHEEQDIHVEFEPFNIFESCEVRSPVGVEEVQQRVDILSKEITQYYLTNIIPKIKREILEIPSLLALFNEIENRYKELLNLERRYIQNPNDRTLEMIIEKHKNNILGIKEFEENFIKEMVRIFRGYITPDDGDRTTNTYYRIIRKEIFGNNREREIYHKVYSYLKLIVRGGTLKEMMRELSEEDKKAFKYLVYLLRRKGYLDLIIERDKKGRFRRFIYKPSEEIVNLYKKMELLYSSEFFNRIDQEKIRVFENFARILRRYNNIRIRELSRHLLIPAETYI